MRILLNVSNLHLAGGLSVGLGVVKALVERNTAHQYLVYVPSKKLYPFADTASVSLIENASRAKGIKKLFADYAFEKRLMKQWQPDKVFTLGNIAMKTSKPQLLMIQWAYLVYPDSVVWRLMSLKEKVIRKFKCYVVEQRLKYVKAVTVQTQVMKSRFGKYISGDLPVHVVSSAFAPIFQEDNDLPSSGPENGVKKILCLTRYYSHKNLEVLIDVAQLARGKDIRNFLFVLTLDPRQPEVQKYLNTMRQEKVEDYFINKGNVSLKDLSSCYRQCDAFVLPTLLETVGLTFLEAMNFGKLVFAPDLDFAREVCQDAAVFVDPQNASDILDKLMHYLGDERAEERKKKVDKGHQLVTANGNWTDIVDQYEKILEAL